MSLAGKTVLITGAAHRVGRALALAVAQAGGDVIVHYGHSAAEAERTQREIVALGRQAYLLQADLSAQAQVEALIPRARELAPLDALVNSAAIFEPLGWEDTSLEDWNRHMQINLTAPFILSQAFAQAVCGPAVFGQTVFGHAAVAAQGREPDPPGGRWRIVNILDWRAFRPGPDHLPYTISKAGLAALTQALARALAPRITVNGLALGAILPPSDGAIGDEILKSVPAGRWAELDEVQQALRFLLDGPPYITGEVIHVDGGRHLV